MAKMMGNGRWIGWQMAVCAAVLLLIGAVSVWAQEQKTAWTEQEKPIVAALGTLRKLPEEARAKKT